MDAAGLLEKLRRSEAKVILPALFTQLPPGSPLPTRKPTSNSDSDPVTYSAKTGQHFLAVLLAVARGHESMPVLLPTPKWQTIASLQEVQYSRNALAFLQLNARCRDLEGLAGPKHSAIVRDLLSKEKAVQLRISQLASKGQSLQPGSDSKVQQL